MPNDNWSTNKVFQDLNKFTYFPTTLPQFNPLVLRATLSKTDAVLPINTQPAPLTLDGSGPKPNSLDLSQTMSDLAESNKLMKKLATMRNQMSAEQFHTYLATHGELYYPVLSKFGFTGCKANPEDTSRGIDQALKLWQGPQPNPIVPSSDQRVNNPQKLEEKNAPAPKLQKSEEEVTEMLMNSLASYRLQVSAEKFHTFMMQNENAIYKVLSKQGYQGSKLKAEDTVKEFDQVYRHWQDARWAKPKGPAYGKPIVPNEPDPWQAVWESAANNPIAAVVIVGMLGIESAADKIANQFGYSAILDPKKLTAVANAIAHTAEIASSKSPMHTQTPEIVNSPPPKGSIPIRPTLNPSWKPRVVHEPSVDGPTRNIPPTQPRPLSTTTSTQKIENSRRITEEPQRLSVPGPSNTTPMRNMPPEKPVPAHQKQHELLNENAFKSLTDGANVRNKNRFESVHGSQMDRQELLKKEPNLNPKDLPTVPHLYLPHQPNLVPTKRSVYRDLKGREETTIIEHHNKGTVGDLTPAELAKQMVEDGWRGGNIRLISCKSGIKDENGRIYADELTKELAKLLDRVPGGKATTVAGAIGDVQMPFLKEELDHELQSLRNRRIGQLKLIRDSGGDTKELLKKLNEMDNRINELEESIRLLENPTEKRTPAVAHSSHSLAELETKQKQLQDQINNINNNNTRQFIENTITDLKNKIESMKQLNIPWPEKQENLKKLENELMTANEQLTEIKLLQNQLQRVDAELARSKEFAENTKLFEEREQLSDSITKLNKEIEELNTASAPKEKINEKTVELQRTTHRLQIIESKLDGAEAPLSVGKNENRGFTKAKHLSTFEYFTEELPIKKEQHRLQQRVEELINKVNGTVKSDNIANDRAELQKKLPELQEVNLTIQALDLAHKIEILEGKIQKSGNIERSRLEAELRVSRNTLVMVNIAKESIEIKQKISYLTNKIEDVKKSSVSAEEKQDQIKNHEEALNTANRRLKEIDNEFSVAESNVQVSTGDLQKLIASPKQTQPAIGVSPPQLTEAAKPSEDWRNIVNTLSPKAVSTEALVKKDRLIADIFNGKCQLFEITPDGANYKISIKGDVKIDTTDKNLLLSSLNDELLRHSERHNNQTLSLIYDRKNRTLTIDAQSYEQALSDNDHAQKKLDGP